MNYAVVYLAGILALSTVYWFVQGRKFYTGPLIEADINEDGGDRSSDDDFAAQMILVDPHSPGMYRCNAPISNIDAWYNAFDVKPGDKMYKPENERIKVW